MSLNRKVKRNKSVTPSGKLDAMNDAFIENGRWLHPTKGWHKRSSKAVAISLMSHAEKVEVFYKTLTGIKTAETSARSEESHGNN